MKLLDSCKFAIATQVQDGATASNNVNYLFGNAINVENYGHLTVVILNGTPGGANGAVTLRQAATLAAVLVGATIVPMSYVYVNTQTATESDTWVKTAVTSNTFTIPATAYLNYIIEINTSVLTYPFVGLNIVASGGSGYLAALYILSQPRYISAEDAPSVIAQSPYLLPGMLPSQNKY